MKEFRCRNLGLAAFISYIGLHHVRTERVGPRSTVFVFADPLDECNRIERDYYSGAGTEDAQRLLESYRDVKATIGIAMQQGVWKNKETDLVSDL